MDKAIIMKYPLNLQGPNSDFMGRFPLYFHHFTAFTGRAQSKAVKLCPPAKPAYEHAMQVYVQHNSNANRRQNAMRATAPAEIASQTSSTTRNHGRSKRGPNPASSSPPPPPNTALGPLLPDQQFLNLNSVY
jgi:hypothetical protein